MVDCQFSQEYGAHNQMGIPCISFSLGQTLPGRVGHIDYTGGQMIVVPTFWKVRHYYPAWD